MECDLYEGAVADLLNQWSGPLADFLRTLCGLMTI